MTDDHSSVEAVALKACPFCGGAGIAREWENWLRCQDCEADGPYKNTQAEAVAAWNTRATPSDQDKVVGELVEEVAVHDGANSHLFDKALMIGGIDGKCIGFSEEPWASRIAAALTNAGAAK